MCSQQRLNLIYSHSCHHHCWMCKIEVPRLSLWPEFLRSTARNCTPCTVQNVNTANDGSANCIAPRPQCIHVSSREFILNFEPPRVSRSYHLWADSMRFAEPRRYGTNAMRIYCKLTDNTFCDLRYEFMASWDQFLSRRRSSDSDRDQLRCTRALAAHAIYEWSSFIPFFHSDYMICHASLSSQLTLCYFNYAIQQEPHAIATLSVYTATANQIARVHCSRETNNNNINNNNMLQQLWMRRPKKK